MSDNIDPENLSIDELQQLLYRKKRALRRRRLDRLQREGRVVDVPGRPPPSPEPGPRPVVSVNGLRSVPAAELEPEEEEPAGWRATANRLLLGVEIAAIVGFVALLVVLWGTRQELNEELAAAQGAEAAAAALPTPTATPVIGVVVLPSGHQPPVEGQPPQPGEAGYVPDHLQPLVANYQPPPIPTPGPEQARRIQIPAIDVDKPIVQGDTWEQLKKGVGQHIGTAAPGQPGNMVLSAHNDIYGEIFRYLDKLTPGDEIIVSTERSSYRYVVREWQIVEPTAVEVMAPTEHASTTLISCYPYLVNNKRIVVFADLVEGEDA
jgi:sortase A